MSLPCAFCPQGTLLGCAGHPGGDVSPIQPQPCLQPTQTSMSPCPTNQFQQPPPLAPVGTCNLQSAHHGITPTAPAPRLFSRNNMRKRKAGTLREKDWEPLKHRILELRRDGTQTIPNIMAKIKLEFGFEATEKQFKDAIKRWKSGGRSITKKEMTAIVRKQQHRKLVEQHKPPLQFEARGMVVAPEKIDRWMGRHKVRPDELYLPLEAETPEGLVYWTPGNSTVNTPAQIPPSLPSPTPSPSALAAAPVPYASRPASPAQSVGCTPAPLPLESIWPETLPWLRFQSIHSFYFSALVRQHGQTIDGDDLQLEFQKISRSSREISGTRSSLSRLASGILNMMPEFYPGEHLRRAKIILGQPGPDLLHECLTFTIYELSNNLRDPGESTWKHTTTVLRKSGLMNHRFDISSLNDATISAFMENLFQVAIHREMKHDDGDDEARVIIQWLLSAGHSPDSPVRVVQFDTTMTALQMASARCRPNIARLLLDCGADVDLALLEESRPLELALDPVDRMLCTYYRKPLAARLEMAHLLISRGAFVSLPVRDGRRPVLNLAIRYGDLDLVKMVVGRGADICRGARVDKSLMFEVTALAEAAGLRDDKTKDKKALALVRYITESLISQQPSTPIATFITADVFIAAAEAGNHNVIRFLSNLAPIAISPNKFGVTPLHAAAQSGCIITCQLFLQLGCPVNSSSNYLSPLHIASAWDHKGVVELLLNSKATLDACADVDEEIFNRHLNRPGGFYWGSLLGDEVLSGQMTPLQLAISFGAEDSVYALIEAGAQLLGGEIVWVAREFNTDLLVALLDAGGDPNDHNDYGETALQVTLSKARGCIGEEDLDIELSRAQILLQYGAKINDGDVVQAIQLGEWPLVENFLENGASLTGSYSGVTALEAALLLNKRFMIKKVFQQHRKTYDAACLCAAVSVNRNMAIVQRLLNNRPTQSPPNMLEATAVGLAAALNDLKILQLLVTSLPQSKTSILPVKPTCSDDGSFGSTLPGKYG